VVEYASDTRWLLLSALGAVTSIGISVFLGWGAIRIVQETGVIGLYQCFSCSDANGVPAPCDTRASCNDWRLIHTPQDCQAAVLEGIRCEIMDLCIYAAPTTFWYSVVVAGVYLIVLAMTAMLIFSRMIPSLFLQSIERTHMI
jgi:hypothetical protein